MSRFVLIQAFLLLVSFAYADDRSAHADGEADPLNEAIPAYRAVIADPKLSMRSGSESLIGLHYGLFRLEDRLIGSRWFDEDNVIGKSGGISARLLKMVVLDVPVDYFAVVLAHEYFGHGARYRELDISNIHYAFDWPPPYGDGGGEASVSIDKSLISDHEELSIWIGGMEIHPQINRELSLDWIASRNVPYREAALYFWSWQIMFNYIQSASGDLVGIHQYDDPQAYVAILNRHAGYADAGHLKFTMEDLQVRNVVSLANPFVVVTLYAQLKSYLYDGNSRTELPMLHFGKVGYLPLLRMGLTPFGPEYHWESYFRASRRAALLDLRIGDRTFYSSWGGVGLSVRNAYSYRRISLDLNLHLWKQPEIQLGGIDGEFKGGGFGGASSVRGCYRVTDARYPVMALLELGYKSPGFVEGYPLDASPILLFGLAVRN